MRDYDDQRHMKTIIYQIFTRLYGNRNTTRKPNGTIEENGCGKMNDIGTRELRKLKALGVTHVWYTGIIRHATQTDYSTFGIPRSHSAVVKGRAGSPYAIADYYDVDPDLAVKVKRRMKEFEALVERTHHMGLKVIIDFVPNHVARQYHSICKPKETADLGELDDTSKGFDPQNNFYYCPGHKLEPSIDLYGNETEAYSECPAKATGNDLFNPRPGQNDWYETVKLNYGVDYYAGRKGCFSPTPRTWRQMTDILLFWADKGVDGFRCDMAEMVPAEFWGYATAEVKRKHDNIVFIGEVYNPAEYRNYIANGFDYLYDKVGMYDTMRAVTCNQCPATAITQAWQATEDIKGNMLYFLENHDEQRIASSQFAGDARRGIPALAVNVLMRTNPFMLYAGEEYGEKGMDSEGFSGKDGRTTIFDYWSMDTLCRAAEDKLTEDEARLAEVHRKILTIANKEKTVSEGLFYDLMYANPQTDHFFPYSNYAFLRKADNELLIVAANFGTEPADISVTLPAHAFHFLCMPERTATATDLLTGEKQSMTLAKDQSVSMRIEAFGARVWKIRLKKPTAESRSSKA